MKDRRREGKTDKQMKNIAIDVIYGNYMANENYEFVTRIPVTSNCVRG